MLLQLGKIILKDNESVYIDKDALVFGCIFAENATPEFEINQLKTKEYDKAVAKLKGEEAGKNINISTHNVGLTNLYTGSQWKTTYETLAVTDLMTNFYYNVELDYRLCNYVSGWKSS